jgi:hypothetical protein
MIPRRIAREITLILIITVNLIVSNNTLLKMTLYFTEGRVSENYRIRGGCLWGHSHSLYFPILNFFSINFYTISLPLIIKTYNMQELTFGQKAVGVTFNPSGDEIVNKVKQEFADLIDLMNLKRQESESSEQKRLCSMAITEMQTSQMWVVRALTWKD